MSESSSYKTEYKSCRRRIVKGCMINTIACCGIELLIWLGMIIIIVLYKYESITWLSIRRVMLDELHIIIPMILGSIVFPITEAIKKMAIAKGYLKDSYL